MIHPYSISRLSRLIDAELYTRNIVGVLSIGISQNDAPRNDITARILLREDEFRTVFAGETAYQDGSRLTFTTRVGWDSPWGGELATIEYTAYLPKPEQNKPQPILIQ